MLQKFEGGAKISWTEFLEYAEGGDIESVEIGDTEIKGKFKSDAAGDASANIDSSASNLNFFRMNDSPPCFNGSHLSMEFHTAVRASIRSVAGITVAFRD